MKFVIHAYSILDQIDGCYSSLLERILHYENGWTCLIPSDFDEDDLAIAEAILEDGNASRDWARVSENELPKGCPLLCLSFPGENDQACRAKTERGPLIVGYNPLRDAETTQNQALVEWDVDTIISPFTPSELSNEATESQTSFSLQQLLNLPPSLGEIPNTESAKTHDNLFLIKSLASDASNRPIQFPCNCPWIDDFNRKVQYWSPLNVPLSKH